MLKRSSFLALGLGLSLVFAAIMCSIVAGISSLTRSQGTGSLSVQSSKAEPDQ